MVVSLPKPIICFISIRPAFWGLCMDYFHQGKVKNVWQEQKGGSSVNMPDEVGNHHTDSNPFDTSTRDHPCLLYHATGLVSSIQLPALGSFLPRFISTAAQLSTVPPCAWEHKTEIHFLMTREGSVSSTGYNPLDSELIGLSEQSLKPPGWFCLCGHGSKKMHMQAGAHVVYRTVFFCPRPSQS